MKRQLFIFFSFALFLINCGGNNQPTKTELCFVAQEDNSKIGYQLDGLDFNLHVQFARNGGSWQDWSGNDITLNKDEKIYVRNTTNTLSGVHDSFIFTMSGKIAASGSVDSMMNNSTLYDSCYNRLFMNCDALVSAPELPTNKLATLCYTEMFSGCTNLVKAPALPAKELAESCYAYMFNGCSKLTELPTLENKTIAMLCYIGMFTNCTSLVDASIDLPSEQLARYCYAYMFDGCTSLTKAPHLSPATLANGCYSCMFKNCSSLIIPPIINDAPLKPMCYSGMFQGCSTLNVSENSGGTLFFTCPSDIKVTAALTDMFKDTGGTFTDKPTANNKYYYNVN